jgi:hypothetical protein
MSTRFQKTESFRTDFVLTAGLEVGQDLPWTCLL